MGGGWYAFRSALRRRSGMTSKRSGRPFSDTPTQSWKHAGLHSPWTPGDAARRLFLQAKSLEALALTITTLSCRRQPSTGLTEADRAKLTAARQLLHDRYDEHWTIATLARTIGMSERKLRTGFRFAIGN